MKYEIKTILVYILALAFLISSVGQKAYATQGVKKVKKGYIVFILDASGSMWGQVQGGSKIGIAKNVLTKLVKNIPDGMNVALVTYGQRREGDCRDVEELVPLAPINKDKFIKKIKAIKPKGKTPITLSIKTTVEKLGAVEEETTIILVSDGRETCEGDPCALVKGLKESGVEFVMNVIGFDVSEDDRKQLQCIAEAGEGKYYAAKDAGAFMLAGKKVVEAPKFIAGFLKIEALKNGIPFTAYINVYRHGEEDKIAGSYAYEPKPATFKLLPGVYDVKAVDDDIPQKPIVIIKTIEVKPGKTVKKTAKFEGEGYLKVEAIEDGKPVSAYFLVYSRDEESVIAGGYSYEPRPIKLLPGVYDVKVQNKSGKKEKQIKGVTVRSGRSQTVDVRF
jgi:Ca-activated chloride channel family protein